VYECRTIQKRSLLIADTDSLWENGVKVPVEQLLILNCVFHQLRREARCISKNVSVAKDFCLGLVSVSKEKVSFTSLVLITPETL